MKTNKKILSLFLSLFLAVGALISPISETHVQAAEKVKIKITYLYVNTKGNNSVYVDTQYVKKGTTWGEFFANYTKCYENGKLKDVNVNVEWEVPGEEAAYNSSEEIENYNQYTDSALLDYVGSPSNYKPAYFNFGYYVNGELTNSGAGWEVLIPVDYKYGSKEAISFINKNKTIYSYIKGLCQAKGTKIKVIPKSEGVDGSWDGYIVEIYVKAALNNTKKVLQTGKSYTLKLTGTKAKSWSSSNKSVATVNSKGKVTAKKAGTAIITCKGKDGKSYKCKVTVTK